MYYYAVSLSDRHSTGAGPTYLLIQLRDSNIKDWLIKIQIQRTKTKRCTYLTHTMPLNYIYSNQQIFATYSIVASFSYHSASFFQLAIKTRAVDVCQGIYEAYNAILHNGAWEM